MAQGRSKTPKLEGDTRETPRADLLPDGVHAMTLSVLGLSTSSKLRSQIRSASKSPGCHEPREESADRGDRAKLVQTDGLRQPRTWKYGRPPTAHRRSSLLTSFGGRARWTSVRRSDSSF